MQKKPIGDLILKKVKEFKNGTKMYYILSYSTSGLEQVVVETKKSIYILGDFNNIFLTKIEKSGKTKSLVNELLKVNNPEAHKQLTYNVFSFGSRYQNFGEPKLDGLLKEIADALELDLSEHSSNADKLHTLREIPYHVDMRLVEPTIE